MVYSDPSEDVRKKSGGRSQFVCGTVVNPQTNRNPVLLNIEPTILVGHIWTQIREYLPYRGPRGLCALLAFRVGTLTFHLV